MRAFLLFFIVAIVTLPISAQLAQPITTTITTPWGVCNGDLNGDGFIDTAVVDSGDGSVSVYYGSSTGTITRTAVLTTSGTSGHFCMTLDFNNDGKLDIVTTNLIPSKISLFLSIRTTVTVGSSGDFNTPLDFSLTFNPAIGLTKADFNLDGNIDIAFLDNSGGVLHVWFGDGVNGMNSLSIFLPGSNPMSLIAADFNSDGNSDIAITIYEAGTSAGSIAVLLGNGAVIVGDGSFMAAVSYTVGTGCYGIGAEDFNTDGKLDLIVMNSAGVSPSISFLPGTSAGTFDKAVTIPTDDYPFDLAVGDYDSDGNWDLAVVSGNTNSISNGELANMTILLGNGAGGFSVGSIYSELRPRNIVSGKYDGKWNVALSNTLSNTWSLFLSTSSTTNNKNGAIVA